MLKIGIIREGKTPPDKRVPLTPSQCNLLLEKYPLLRIGVQPSIIRAFSDTSYSNFNIPLQEDLSDCDVLLGVKEVPETELIAGKTYLFFSHTFKMQPYNRSLLQTILRKKISLIDYECLTDERGRRLIGFGKYAGIVGAYNALLAAGKKWSLFELKPAHKCKDRGEVEKELKKVKLPSNFKIVLTGKGRVASGANEILQVAALKKVSPEGFTNEKFDEAVYCQLSVVDYNKRADGQPVDKKEFYAHPERFESNFMKYAKVSDLYISCHYWDSEAPFIFTKDDAKQEHFRIGLVADISCDINGPIASTVRASTIEKPLYGYDPLQEKEVKFMDEAAIGVMAVDNLPCELPMDASEDFGKELMNKIIPELLRKEDSKILANARETSLDGVLTEKFRYLQPYVDGKE